MEDQAFTDAPGAHGGGDPAPVASFDRSAPLPGRRIGPDEILERWAVVCRAASFGADDISFDDPRAIVRAVWRVVWSPAAASNVEALERAVLHSRVHPAVGVVQLVALRRALHHLTERGVVGVHDEHHPMDLAFDRAINLAIVAILDDLEQRGLVDPLTGLLNRRALDRDLVELIRASGRHERCLVVIMADLEGLKATNDTLGHAAGDERLQHAARTLASPLRTGDNVYRIGGDEFVIVMPDLELRDLAVVLDRVDDATATSLTWGCAWERILPDVDADEAAREMLALADQRLLDFRAAQLTEPVARNAKAEIVAGRFGPVTTSAPGRT